jgi:hypothetical protein
MVLEHPWLFQKVLIIDPYLNKDKKEIQPREPGIISFYKELSDLSDVGVDLCWVANSTIKHLDTINLILKFLKPSYIIVEKPILYNAKAFKLLPTKKANIYEAAMYVEHNCWRYIEILLNSQRISSVSFKFIIPKTESFETNGEWNTKKIISDVGYYPINTIVRFFSQDLDIHKLVLNARKTSTNTKLIYCLELFSGGALVEASFGISNFYCNQLHLTFDDREYTFKYVYSKPHSYCELVVKKNRSSRVKRILIWDKNHFLKLILSVISSAHFESNIGYAKKTSLIMNGLENREE